MIKTYKLTGFSGIISLLIIFILLIILAIMLSPFIIILIFLIVIYLIYRKSKKSIEALLREIKKKKIKITDESSKGEVEIHFAKNIPVKPGEVDKSEGNRDRDIKDNKKYDSGNKYNTKEYNNNKDVNNYDTGTITIENREKKNLNDKVEDEFIKYLIGKGFIPKDEILYYNNKSIYPIYKKSYPVNEIIRLYSTKPEVDMIVLGLKGTPDNPKFIYFIPIEESKERMSIEELKEYLKNSL